MQRFKALGRRPRMPATFHSDLPDWEQADPAWIKGALTRSQKLPCGGWHVLGASDAIGAEPSAYRVCERDLVAFRQPGGQLLVGPDICPHMGAPLSGGRVDDAGRIVCPWHAMPIDERGCRGFRWLKSFDDGVLSWVRIDSSATALTDRPYLCQRPGDGLSAVMYMEAVCDPEDVIANRLDPWHGSHYHPHSFGNLRVVHRGDDDIVVRVVYRLPGGFGVEVDARFHTTDPRTIVMTIIDGEGTGSVVETHARAIEAGRTAIVEATVATSERRGFGLVTRMLGRALRPLVVLAARRLWVEDAAYAERRYALRRRGYARAQTAALRVAP